MWLYFFLVYVPFFFFMLARHDVRSTSMSAIGWVTGGLFYLALYVALTVPFCLCLLFFFNRRFLQSKPLRALSCVAGFFITAGAFIPLRAPETDDWVSFAHTFVSVSGTVVLMLCILAALAMHAIRQKGKRAAISLCAIALYAFALAKAFLLLWTAALYQLSAGASFFLVLLVVSSVSSKHAPSPEHDKRMI